MADLAFDDLPRIARIKAALLQLRKAESHVLALLRDSSQLQVQQAMAAGANSCLILASQQGKIADAVLSLMLKFRMTGRTPAQMKVATSVKALGTALASLDSVARDCGLLNQKVVQDASTILLEAAQEHDLKEFLRQILDYHDQTFRHSLLVSGLSAALALRAQMNAADCQTVAQGALLHDIGKSFIPLLILNKSGPLSA